jgi:hypothetical protein
MFPWLSVAALVSSSVAAPSDLSAPDFAAALARHAEFFRQNARLAVAQETLVQRSYVLPPHPHFAIGSAAGPLYAQFLVHQITSQYGIGSIKGDQSGSLFEVREILNRDGEPVQTPGAARKAMDLDISSGEARIRKKILTEFTAFGLVDVATDYGLILLAFTNAGLRHMEMEPGDPAWIGTEAAVAFDWRQKDGGALEFRGRKVARRPMHGRIWLRQSDGLPLRVSASIEHDEAKHTLRDDATVDFVLAGSGCVTPASVAHRHVVDGKILTENLYTYSQFRLFTTDTSIRYEDATPPKK